MKRLKWEQQKDERMRQQIKENRFIITHPHKSPQQTLYLSIPHTVVYSSLELRELEARLKAGYMNKERAAQIAEKKALKTKDEV